uniref:Transposase n=1 Tax=Esox lucius TaxID=8010 RepID=A0AAY5KHF6_ESOLU
MVRTELPKHQSDLIVERYQSGEGYKIISKALDIWNTVKTVIIKWRKYGTTGTLPRTGRPSKIYEKMRRKLVREASKRPTETLKELQEFLARVRHWLKCLYKTVMQKLPDNLTNNLLECFYCCKTGLS